MGERKTISLIRGAVKSGKLKEPFGAKDTHNVCPSIPLSTCHVFLPKHRVGNPGDNTELFLQIDRGVYKLK